VIFFTKLFLLSGRMPGGASMKTTGILESPFKGLAYFAKCDMHEFGLSAFALAL